jgi:hypothetical protein
VSHPVTGFPSDAAAPGRSNQRFARQRAFKYRKFVLPIGKNPSDLTSKTRTNGERMGA